MANPKLVLKRTDDDFADWQVSYNGNHVQSQYVVEASVSAGELELYDTDGNGLVLPDKSTKIIKGRVGIHLTPTAQAKPQGKPTETATAAQEPPVHDVVKEVTRGPQPAAVPASATDATAASLAAQASPPKLDETPFRKTV